MYQEKLLSDKLKTDRKVLEEAKELIYLIDYVQHSMLILNEDDEIVHANKSFLNLLELDSINFLIGHELRDVIKYADPNGNDSTSGMYEACKDQSSKTLFLHAKARNAK